MKKIILFIIIFICVISCENKKENTKPIIIVSIPPLELILQEIVKDNFVIKTMLPQGASPHTHEIVPNDIKLLNSAAIMFYVSNDLDAWACKYPAKAKAVRLMDYISNNENAALLKENCGEHNHNSKENIDPHFWISPMMVKSIIDSIAEEISLLDTKNKNIYMQNAAQFKLKLDSLHNTISKKFAPLDKNKMLLNTHNSFSYFTAEFGLKDFIAIEESPGKEISTRYFLELVNEIKKNKAKCIFSEPQLNSKISDALAKDNNLAVILLDPLNSYFKKKNYCDFVLCNAENILMGIKK